jgi:hypothetical protein
MVRLVPAILVASVFGLATQSAEAQWMTTFSEGVCRGYHRNKAWPEPFLMPDRAAVNIPFAMMVANGWRRQNLLSDYHFNEDTQQLNQAGEMKLRYILTQQMPSRRTVFVQRGLTPDVTASRMAMVEREAARITPAGASGGVVESDLANDGWPADEIDTVSRRFIQTQPDPRLPDSPAADQSSAGSGNSN